MNVTLDGCMAGPDDELDWHFAKWTEEMAEWLCILLSQADTILLGRTTYTAMAGYWPQRSTDFTFPRDDIAFADMMNNHAKIVFSKTLKKVEWHNSTLVKGDAGTAIKKLKQQHGKDIIIFGSGKLVASLIHAGLVDDYVLWVHPVILANGRPLFAGLHNRLNMRLVKVKKFTSGVIVLHYSIINTLGAG
jgi:dihydrofolate reductase